MEESDLAKALFIGKSLETLRKERILHRRVVAGWSHWLDDYWEREMSGGRTHRVCSIFRFVRRFIQAEINKHRKIILAVMKLGRKTSSGHTDIDAHWIHRGALPSVYYSLEEVIEAAR